MQLTLQAAFYMICLHAVLVLASIVLWAARLGDEFLALSLSGVLNLGLLCLFYMGLKREYLAVALPFLAWCMFDFFAAISGGMSLMNIPDLVGAILSFVAICGIFVWVRDRSPVADTQGN